MTPKIRADYIAKLVLYVNASIGVCCWGSLPTGADYYDTYNSLDLIALTVTGRGFTMQKKHTALEVGDEISITK